MLDNKSKAGKIIRENRSLLPLKKFNVFNIKRTHANPVNSHQFTSGGKNKEIIQERKHQQAKKIFSNQKATGTIMFKQ